MSPTEAQLLQDIMPFFQVRAHVVMRCLRKLEGLGPEEPASEDQIASMIRQIEAQLDLTGRWWRFEEPTWIERNGWRNRGELIIWVQHLRMACGESPEVFAPTLKHPGDPLWSRTSRWLASALDEQLYAEGLPRACHKLVKAGLRQKICDRYGVPSMRHLPGTICQREAIALILECDLNGAHEALELEDIKEQLRAVS